MNIQYGELNTLVITGAIVDAYSQTFNNLIVGKHYKLIMVYQTEAFFDQTAESSPELILKASDIVFSHTSPNFGPQDTTQHWEVDFIAQQNNVTALYHDIRGFDVDDAELENKPYSIFTMLIEYDN